MFDFSNHTAFENQKQNDSNALLDNQSIILDFALLEKQIEQKIMFEQTGPGLKVFVGISLLIMETFGNYLLFCMVWYEKFGMDSKKRTVTNQLLSRMIFALIFFNIFFMPLIFGALLIPYSEYYQGFYVTVFKNFCPNFYNFLL